MTNLARLPSWPRLLRRTLAAAYVDMTAREFDQAVAAGQMPDPMITIAGERWDRRAIDEALDRTAGDGVADWRSFIGRSL